MIKMTYNQALKIQEGQLNFYCRGVSPEEEARIRKLSTAAGEVSKLLRRVCQHVTERP